MEEKMKGTKQTGRTMQQPCLQRKNSGQENHSVKPLQTETTSTCSGTSLRARP